MFSKLFDSNYRHFLLYIYIYITPRAKVYFKRLLLHQNIIYSKSQKRAYFMKIKTFFFLVFWLTNLSLYLYIYIKIWLTKLIKKT